MKKLSVFLFTIALFSFLPRQAFAQESLGLSRTMTIIPPTAQQVLNPGQITEGTMKVINESDETLTFTTDTRDYIVVDTQGTPNLLAPSTLNSSYSAASWIGVSPNVFTIKPHEKQILSYYLQIPGNARPGGHYAAVVFTPSNLKADVPSTSGSGVNTEIGTLFYITVNGQINENSVVSKFSAPGFQEYGPVRISTQIHNLGDLHIRPSGTITVKDLFGNSQVMKLKEFNIFPTASRDYVNVYGQTWMFGRYEAHLLASYGRANNLPLIATVVFWVIPWRLIIVIILAIIAIILGIMYRKKKKKETHHEAESMIQPSTPTAS